MTPLRRGLFVEEAMSEILTAHEMAIRLKIDFDAFRKTNWKKCNHLFVGTGKTLRSARFIWTSDLSHLGTTEAAVASSSAEKAARHRKAAATSGIR